MGNIINKLIVLKLNKVWAPVGYTSVGRAISDLAAGLSAKALDLDYKKDENNEYILDEFGVPVGEPTTMNPLDWEDWLLLPVRPFDEIVHYGNGEKIMRVPTILIARNFNRMPYKTFRGKPSKEALWYRDNGTDQYTGRKLKREESSIDHVIPQSKGGNNDWTNLLLTSKEINAMKGNKLNSEIGLKPIKLPTVPRPIPISSLIKEPKHFSWQSFLKLE